jgi:hypothetical protein
MAYLRELHLPVDPRQCVETAKLKGTRTWRKVTGSLIHRIQTHHSKRIDNLRMNPGEGHPGGCWTHRSLPRPSQTVYRRLRDTGNRQAIPVGSPRHDLPRGYSYHRGDSDSASKRKQCFHLGGVEFALIVPVLVAGLPGRGVDTPTWCTWSDVAAVCLCGIAGDGCRCDACIRGNGVRSRSIRG